MTGPDFTPLDRERFGDMAWLHRAENNVLAEHHAQKAIDADTDDECHWHVHQANLHATRAVIAAINDVLDIMRAISEGGDHADH